MLSAFSVVWRFKSLVHFVKPNSPNSIPSICCRFVVQQVVDLLLIVSYNKAASNGVMEFGLIAPIGYTVATACWEHKPWSAAAELQLAPIQS